MSDDQRMKPNELTPEEAAELEQAMMNQFLGEHRNWVLKRWQSLISTKIAKLPPKMRDVFLQSSLEAAVILSTSYAEGLRVSGCPGTVVESIVAHAKIMALEQMAASQDAEAPRIWTPGGDR